MGGHENPSRVRAASMSRSGRSPPASNRDLPAREIAAEAGVVTKKFELPTGQGCGSDDPAPASPESPQLRMCRGRPAHSGFGPDSDNRRLVAFECTTDWSVSVSPR